MKPGDGTRYYGFEVMFVTKNFDTNFPRFEIIYIYTLDENTYPYELCDIYINAIEFDVVEMCYNTLYNGHMMGSCFNTPVFPSIIIFSLLSQNSTLYYIL